MSRMGDRICFDTTPLIWGVRGEATVGQEHEIAKTKRYIDFLKRTNKQIMVPTPVLAEYLIGASLTELNEMKILQQGFQIPGLDLPSAALAAELQRGGVIREVQDEFGLPRECVKTDAMIIAIAIKNQAIKIVTNNERHFKRLAQNRIPISGVPEVDGQLNLGI
jgi:predicted nucleic acid-binding protein